MLILEKNEMYRKFVKENKDPKIFDRINHFRQLKVLTKILLLPFIK